MPRLSQILLLFLSLSGDAAGQNLALQQLPILGGGPQPDIRYTFGLVEDNPGEAANNRLKLQKRLNGGAPIYPWFFPGATGTTKAYFFDNTLVLPNDAGRAWLGTGRSSPGGIGGGKVLGSQLCLRAKSSQTLFDGAATTATTATESNIVKITGRQVNPLLDPHNSLYISGGTNFIAGWYGIAAANETNNTWTLDRRCTTGPGEAMTGTYCPAMIRNHGFGTYHRGLQFSHQRLRQDSTNGSICYHIATNQISGGVATGKHLFTQCSFGYAEVGILCGRDLAEFNSPTTRGQWVGKRDNHADNLRTEHCHFTHCASAICIRNEQSVAHSHTAIHAIGITDALFKVDAGGKLTADSVEIAGWSGTQAILKLGRGVTSGSSPYTFRGVGFDGGKNTRNPQLVVTDWHRLDRRALVVFDGVMLSRAPEHDHLPLVDIQSDLNLRLYNIAGRPGNANGGIWPKSIRLRQGRTAAYKPHVIVMGCVLSGVKEPEDIIDEANCDPGITVEFFGNCQPGGEPLANKTFTTK